MCGPKGQVWFLSAFVMKMVIAFDHFGLKIRYVFLIFFRAHGVVSAMIFI